MDVGSPRQAKYYLIVTFAKWHIKLIESSRNGKKCE